MPSEVAPTSRQFAPESPAPRAELTDPHIQASPELQALSAFLRQPEVVGLHLHELAVTACHSLAHILPSTEIITTTATETLSDAAWSQCIDPAQPTIGLRFTAFGKTVTPLVVAAQKLRRQAEAVCNVIILPELAFAQEGATKQAYFAERGLLINADGHIYGGNFPYPLQIDATHLYASGTVPQAEPSVIRFFNEQAEDALINDKLAAQTVLSQAGVPIAKALLEETTVDDAAFRSQLEQCFKDGQAIVIKPLRDSQGHGVIMLDPRTTTLRAAEEHIGAVHGSGRKVRVEQWISSYPLRHAGSGVRLDWNIRSLLVGSGAVGAYARIGTFGTPINYTRGAQPAAIAAVLQQCGLDEQAQAVVTQRLEAVYQRSSTALPGIIKGLDIIIDENLHPVVIEPNGEASGGLLNSMQHSGSGDWVHDWQPAFNMVRHLHTALFDGDMPAKRQPDAYASTLDPHALLAGMVFFEASSLAPESSGRYATLLAAALPHMPPLEGRLNNALLESLKAQVAEAKQKGEMTEELAELYALKLEPQWVEAFQAFEQGNLDMAFAIIAGEYRADPLDTTVQKKVATHASVLLSDDNSFLLVAHSYCSETMQGSEVLAKTLYYELLLAAGCDDLGISLQSRQHILDQLEIYFQQPMAARQFPTLDTMPLSPDEKSYLKPAFDIGRHAEAIFQGRHTELQQVLRHEIREQNKANILLAPQLSDDMLSTLLSTHFMDNPDCRQTICLIYTALNCFAEAYAQIMTLAPELRQAYIDEITVRCCTVLASKGNDPTSFEAQATARLVVQTVAAITTPAQDQAVDWAALATLNQTLQSYGFTDTFRNITGQIHDYITIKYDDTHDDLEDLLRRTSYTI